MTWKNLPALALGVALLALAGIATTACDSANPVAPSGTTLSVSASPSQIGLNGSSQITIIGRRPDGSALFPGTEIAVATSLGSIQPLVEVGEGGVATATLRADGRSGTATVTAVTTGGGSGGAEGGGGATMSSVEVEIGIPETGLNLTVSASPTQIALDGSSTITVVGRRSDGSAVAAGTEFRLTTTLGSIPAVVSAGSDGIATATLRGDGRSGTATVTASAGSGDNEVMGTVEVQIGESDETRPTVTLTANPNNIAVLETSEITVIGRNPDGSPVRAGLPVTLTSDLGSISPRTLTTDSGGLAVATLTAGTQAGEATITAFVGASDAATTTLTIRDAASDVTLGSDKSSIPRTGTGNDPVELTALATNAQGQPLGGIPITFNPQIGSLSSTTVLTNAQGIATTTLAVTETETGNRSSFQVTAEAPENSGMEVSDTITINITG